MTTLPPSVVFNTAPLADVPAFYSGEPIRRRCSWPIIDPEIEAFALHPYVDASTVEPQVIGGFIKAGVVSYQLHRPEIETMMVVGGPVRSTRLFVSCTAGTLLYDSSAWRRQLERLIVELGRLTDGWEGSGSRAPVPQALRDMEAACRNLPAETLEPEAEIDASDGSVTLRWWTSDGISAFALTFAGDGCVVGIASTCEGAPPPVWSCEVTDETKLIDRLDDALIKRALLGDAPAGYALHR